MSRTDKDAPLWVQAEKFEPRHTCQWSHRTCDLPAEPIRQLTMASPWRQGTRCTWWPDAGRRRVFTGSGVPHWYVDHVWNSPQRAQVRDELRQAVKEYRGSGEVDVVPSVAQARNCAKWLYW